MKSIMQDEKICYRCGTTIGLEKHHIFYGSANRRLSEEDGCFIYLCRQHHTGMGGVHYNPKVDATIKERCERKYCEVYGKSIADFVKRYGKNYIDEEF